MKSLGPEPFVTIEPGDGVVHRRGIETAGDGAARLLARDQAGVGEHVEMFHDRRQRDRERLRQRSDRQAGLLGKPHHQRPARRVGKGRKSAVERRAAILNHGVKYKGVRGRVNRHCEARNDEL